MPPDAPPPKRRKLRSATKKATGTPSLFNNSVTTSQPPVSQAVPAGTSSSSGTKGPKKNPAWTGLETALQGLRISAGSFPPLQSAVSALATCLEVFEAGSEQQASTHREEYETLATELEAVANFLQKHLNVAKSSRIMGVIASVSRVNELFSRLQIEIGMDAWSIANEHLSNTRLEGLNPAKQARYDSSLGAEIGRRQCTERTREATLADFYNWTDDPDAKPMYLINGMAGTGKTTIAYSMAKMLEDDGRLGASFFCTRASESCRDVNRIIPSILYQLARYSTTFQSLLCPVLDADPDLGSRNLTVQFERLLLEPLLQMKKMMPKHVVVVIDALDECANVKAARILLDLLIQFAAELPVKFLVTGRPKPEIQVSASQAEDVVCVHHLHEIECSLVQKDIEIYLWKELSPIRPSRSQIAELAKLAGSLFIFAATAVRYIRPDGAVVHSTERLTTFLTNNPKPDNKRFNEIDALYSTVLALALGNDQLEAEEIERMQTILWAVVCIQVPISVETLAVLADVEDITHVSIALEPLPPVLHVSENTGLVYIFHASFPEYLFHRERSGQYFCDQMEQHRRLAQQCFKLMEKQLRFNICSLQSSYIFDQAVPDLKQRIESNISAPLVYACQFWANHLCFAPVSLELCDVLYTFLTKRLLFWMEVLNLKRCQVAGLRALPKVHRWATVNSGSDASYDLHRFTHDATIFVSCFFTSSASLSTPHIYISALPISPERNEPTTQNVDLKLETSADSALISFALSLDGKHFATGSNQGVISLWDLNTRTVVANSFVGRAKSIFAVQFSPDGRYIASGTHDGSIWINTCIDEKLSNIYGPFEGHSGFISSVDFSADGQYIVSGSSDCSIRIWDIAEGLVAGPCHGHSGAVRSVRFSPDGSKIASSSDDCGVFIWDVTDGKMILGPLERHTDIIWSVDFSPDGEFLVSGSNDGTMCIWNSTCGTLIAAQLEPKQHTGAILSAKYSCDGRVVYCGFQDNILRIWDIFGKQFVSTSSRPHKGEICSTVVSPDGIRILSSQHARVVEINDRIVSGDCAGLFRHLQLPHHNLKAASVGFSASGDKIISVSKCGSVTCLWDSATGELVKGPLNGRMDTLWSVALPGGNTRIATRTNGQTIHIWDEDSGTIVSAPFQEGVGRVLNLRLSVDGQRIISNNSTTLTLCTPYATNWICDPAYSPSVVATYDFAAYPGDLPEHTGVTDGPTKPARDCLKAYSLTMWSTALSPDGVCIAISGVGTHDHDIYIWDVTLDHSIAGPFIGHSSSVRSIGFSSDGASIISGSDNKSIRMWDAALGATIGGAFEGHTCGVLSTAFSPDNKYIASGSGDRTVRIWSVANRTFVTCRRHADSVWAVDFSPSGTCVVSSSFDQVIIVWDPADGSIIAGPFNDRDTMLGITPNVPSYIYPTYPPPTPSPRTPYSLPHMYRIPRMTSPPTPSPSTVYEDRSSWTDSYLQLYSSKPTNIPPLPGVYSKPLRRSTRNKTMPRANSWHLRHDGWWVNLNAELLFWVPPEHHSPFGKFYDESITCGHEINLGDTWFNCYSYRDEWLEIF